MSKEMLYIKGFKCLTLCRNHDSIAVEIKTYIMIGENLYYGT